MSAADTLTVPRALVREAMNALVDAEKACEHWYRRCLELEGKPLPGPDPESDVAARLREQVEPAEDDSRECWTCRGTGEGAGEGACSACRGRGSC